MGRGLSELQRYILRRAGAQRRLYRAEVLEGFFGWEPTRRPLLRSPAGELQSPGAQHFSRERAADPLVLLDGPGPATADEKAANCADGTNTRGHGSNSADYLTARIARDRPDVLERMKAA